MATPSISSLLQQATHQLDKLSDSPLLDAQLMLAHILNKDRSYLMAWPEAIPTQQECDLFNQFLQQRIEAIPVAYILGYKEFWSMPFKVTPDVLIPRPETELLVEQVLKLVSDVSNPQILELGTGSGAIAIALEKELPNAQIIATDFSTKALTIAKTNAKALSINQLNFIQSDWFSDIPNSQFNIIVSNPPYIEQHDPHLKGEIRFEPIQALTSGDDGLDDIRIIVKNSVGYLKPGGTLLIEHGFDQGNKVSGLMKESGFIKCQTLSDYSQNDRITLGFRQ